MFYAGNITNFRLYTEYRREPISEFNDVLKFSCVIIIVSSDRIKEGVVLSYIRANEFTLQSETVNYIYQYAPELGYSEDEIETSLAAFDRSFLRVFYDKAKAEDENSIVTKDLDAFINGHAYGYGTRFCLLRYGR